MTTRDVYTAIADPTRREILTLLRDAGQLNAGEIAARFPSRARPGISRHLRVLRECGVVSAEPNGKARRYAIDAEPLVEMRNGWLAGFGDMQRDSLSALRRQVEG